MVSDDIIEDNVYQWSYHNQDFCFYLPQEQYSLRGHLISHDEMSVFLKAEKTQMVYKHRISMIEPDTSFCNLFRWMNKFPVWKFTVSYIFRKKIFESFYIYFNG
jgi:hypothetical protein